MMLEMGRTARAAAEALRKADAATRTAAIRAIAAQLRARAGPILAANAGDVAKATRLVDRLRLDPARLAAIAAGVDQIAALPDSVGAEMARWQRPNGLDIARVRTPIGVIGMIFESRPNVAADAAAIALTHLAHAPRLARVAAAGARR
jgi:glutamate-5-semialdehyde dehydrogenase